VVESPPSKHKALSSNPNSTKIDKQINSKTPCQNNLKTERKKKKRIQSEGGIALPGECEW
jgi:hypothetical protein